MSDYPGSLCFSCFLVALDISMVGWTSRLDGALDVLSRRCIGHLVSTVHWTSSKGPRKSYKYDLTNSLVPLIALSLDHQNHSKWLKWGHVRYNVSSVGVGGEVTVTAR